MALTCLGGYLSAGGAGAINHGWDRDIDARMARTASRPVAAGTHLPAGGVWFGIVAGRGLVRAAGGRGQPAGRRLSLAGFAGYVGVYTMWLKRSTPQNIVIGGAAGAVPPLVGWAAVSGSFELDASLLLFAIVFYWTPPHFWALSLLMREEYARVGVPMMPVVRGDRETRRQILLYTLLLYAVTQLPFCVGVFGVPYLVASMALGACSSPAPSCSSGAPTAAARCACTCSRSSTWRCCSASWCSTSDL